VEPGGLRNLPRMQYRKQRRVDDQSLRIPDQLGFYRSMAEILSDHLVRREPCHSVTVCTVKDALASMSESNEGLLLATLYRETLALL
jgi:hypothetical protein